MVLQHLPMITGGVIGDLRQIRHLNASLRATFKATGIVESDFKVSSLALVLSSLTSFHLHLPVCQSTAGSLAMSISAHARSLFDIGLTVIDETCLLRSPSKTAYGKCTFRPNKYRCTRKLDFGKTSKILNPSSKILNPYSQNPKTVFLIIKIPHQTSKILCS